eukprot:1156796-Pelagomonas_calceolata.AAC.8
MHIYAHIYPAGDQRSCVTAEGRTNTFMNGQDQHSCVTAGGRMNTFVNRRDQRSCVTAEGRMTCTSTFQRPCVAAEGRMTCISTFQRPCVAAGRWMNTFVNGRDQRSYRTRQAAEVCSLTGADLSTCFMLSTAGSNDELAFYFQWQVAAGPSQSGPLLLNATLTSFIAHCMQCREQLDDLT